MSVSLPPKQSIPAGIAPQSESPSAPAAAEKTVAAPPRQLALADSRVRFVVALAALVLSLAALGVAGPYIYSQVSAAVHWRKAKQAIADYDFARAEEHLKRCVEVWPNSGEVQFLMARTARRANDLDTAREHLQEAKRLQWVPQQIRLESLLLLAQTGLATQVEKTLRDYLERGHPEGKLILEALVIGYCQSKFVNDAYRWSKVWLENYPNDWYAVYWDGRVMEIGLQDESAADDYKRVLEMNPGHVESHYRLAETLLRTGHNEEAMEHFQTVLKSDPTHAGALLGLARCQHSLRPTEETKATLDRLFAVLPDDVNGLFLRGQLELEGGNPQEALAWFQRVLQLDPVNRLANQNMVFALRLLKREKEAAEYDHKSQQIDADFRRVDEIIMDLVNDPKNVPLRCELGALLLRVGEKQQAFRWLIGALLVDPNSKETKKLLADCLRQLGDPKLESAYRRIIEEQGKADLQNQSQGVQRSEE